MIYFNNDYSEGCLPEIMDKLISTNLEQTPGYGVDSYCLDAADKIKKLCNREDMFVHFLVGGTQTNLTVIAASLRPHQGVIAAVTGHISVHETGSIEATGHKVIEIPGIDGKISAEQITKVAASQSESMDADHTVQPKMVYISSSTELGTLYTLKELEEIRQVCDQYKLYLFVDGARMGYGLTAKGNDVQLPDFARLCDAFYIGGTKVGALFGEAVVLTSATLLNSAAVCLPRADCLVCSLVCFLITIYTLRSRPMPTVWQIKSAQLSVSLDMIPLWRILPIRCFLFFRMHCLRNLARIFALRKWSGSTKITARFVFAPAGRPPKRMWIA